MTALTPARAILQQEETRYLAAVSESAMQRLGGAMNLIMEQEYQQKTWYVNGNISILSTPFYGIDGLEIVEFDCNLINAFMYVKTQGSSGSLTMDVKYCPAPGGAWTSIFSTLPSISYQATTAADGNFAWVYLGSTFSYTTAPVLAVTSLPAGTVLRADILSNQGGAQYSCGLILSFQPSGE